MTIEFNDKGKYFTDIISKQPVPAIVQTTVHRIEGVVHVRPDQRLKDELDRPELFLAITDASIFDQNGGLLHKCKFLSVQRSQIVWVTPMDTDDASESE